MNNTKTRLPDGSFIRFGQLHRGVVKLNDSDTGPRNGSPKRLTTPQPTYGAVHQGLDRSKLSPYHHGIPKLDEPLEGNKTYERETPLHSSTRSEASGIIKGNPNSRHHRGNRVDGEGRAILDEAGLGRPIGGYRR